MNAVIIAMWSGPRNISTAMMRSFENREDTFVSDEPFYAHYLKLTGIDHPMRKEVMETRNSDWDEVSQYLTGTIPQDKSVWYQKHRLDEQTNKLFSYSQPWGSNIVLFQKI